MKNNLFLAGAIFLLAAACNRQPAVQTIPKQNQPAQNQTRQTGTDKSEVVGQSVEFNFTSTSVDFVKMWQDNPAMRSLKIYDSDGKLVKEAVVESMGRPIIINGLIPGNYIATVENLGPSGSNRTNFVISSNESSKVILDIKAFY